MQSRVLEFVRRDHIRRVVLVARWESYTDGDRNGHFDILLSQKGMPQTRTRETARQSVVDSLQRTVEAYSAAGVSIDIVAQVPEQIHRPIGIFLQAQMHADAAGFIRSSSLTVSDHRSHGAFMREVFAAYASNPSVRVIDLSTALCDVDRCIVGVPSESYYRDKNHLSEAGALRLAGELGRQTMALGNGR